MTTYINNVGQILRQMGHTVDVITLFGCVSTRVVKEKLVHVSDRILKGRGVITILFYSLSCFILKLQVLRQVFCKRYDIFYAADMGAANVIADLGRSFQKRLFLRNGASNTQDLLAQGKIRKGSVAHRFFLKQERSAYARVHRVIPAGMWSFKNVKRICPCSSVNDPIYTPIDTNTFVRDETLRKAWRQQWNVHEELLFLFPGRLDYRKGGHIFIAVVAELIKKGSPIKGVLIGTGAELTRLKEQVQQWGMENEILFSGVLAHKDMVGAYSAADVFMMPALPLGDIEEAMPIGAFEAMACQLPVIVSAIGGIRYFIKHGHDGYLAALDRLQEDLEQYSCEIIQNKNQAEEMGCRARQKIIETCAQEMIGAKLMQAFSSV